MKVFDVGWLAGFLEGDGGFYTYHTQNRGRLGYPLISATSIDKETLQKAKRIFGGGRLRGPYNKKGDGSWNRKPIYELWIQAELAQTWMWRLLPYMSQRRKSQIRKVLAYNWVRVHNSPGTTAKCHPRRKHAARRMCGACYQQWHAKRAA